MAINPGKKTQRPDGVAGPSHGGATDVIDVTTGVVAKVDAMPNLNLFGWDYGLDAAIRNTRVVDPMRYGYAYESANQELLEEMGVVMGHEGSDYQNPYVWQSRGVLGYPNPLVPPPGGLLPKFGIVGDSIDNVAMNIAASSHILEV